MLILLLLRGPERNKLLTLFDISILNVNKFILIRVVKCKCITLLYVEKRLRFPRIHEPSQRDGRSHIVFCMTHHSLARLVFLLLDYVCKPVTPTLATLKYAIYLKSWQKTKDIVLTSWLGTQKQ
jgi:hypothetical protein